MIWQTVAALSVCICFAIVWGYTNYRKRKQEQEVYATETRIGKQVHDEIANDIYQTMQKVEYTSLDKEELLNRLDDIYQRSRNISRSHSAITTSVPFQELLTELLASYRTATLILVSTGITHINWEEVSEIRKVCLYRVLQELMTNMRKHSEATMVKLSFSSTGKKIHIDYTDNGVGTDLEHKSGLQNAENRIKAIHGSITFTSSKGNGLKATLIV